MGNGLKYVFFSHAWVCSQAAECLLGTRRTYQLSPFYQEDRERGDRHLKGMATKKIFFSKFAVFMFTFVRDGTERHFKYQGMLMILRKWKVLILVPNALGSRLRRNRYSDLKLPTLLLSV